MRTLRLLCHTAAFAVIFFLSSSLVQAQATRTWVSGVGDDANPCSRTAPCRTFAGAHAKTAAGGEIDCLDAGSFNTVTITNSLTIDCGGGDAGQVGAITAAGANGIVVAASAGDVVTLRNLTINGIGSGINGIRLLSGTLLHIQSVGISNFTMNGIDVNMTTGAQMTLRNVSIGDVGASGVNLTDTVAFSAALDNVQISNAVTGVHASANSKAALIRCSIIGTLTGLNADAANAEINADTTLLAYGGTGVTASGGGLARISNSNLNNNGTGVSGNVGSFTPGTNRFASNSSDGSFGLAALSLK